MKRVGNKYYTALDWQWWRITGNSVRLCILFLFAVVSIIALVSCADGNGNGNGSGFSTDSDGDLLIDINNLDMLNNIRYNLLGTSYKTSASDTGMECGSGGNTACQGYELMRNLDFADAASYAKNTINNDWRPTDSDGNAAAPADAVNAGWVPLGYSTDQVPSITLSFSATFEGNGYAISNLYVRSITNDEIARIGLFGRVGRNNTVRNLAVIDGNVYGGSQADRVGILAGEIFGANVINCSVRGGSANGEGNPDDGTGVNGDHVGGLVGISLTGASLIGSTIAASYATATVNGGENASDYVGGLIGSNSAIIIASYATGDVDGGTGLGDGVGGFAGQSNTRIIASYATGVVSGGVGDADRTGGLVGQNLFNVTASYATGAVDGGSGARDTVGALVAVSTTPPIVSYGFGAASGEEFDGIAGSPMPPASASAIVAAIAGCSDGLATVMSACTGETLKWVTWGTEAGGAWDFGNAMQVPALKYADYDGTGGIDYCALFRTSSGTITCGTTFIPGQPER